MAVDVTTSPTFQAGPPKLLFWVPTTVPLVGMFRNDGMQSNHGDCGVSPDCGENETGNISRDGQRFVFEVPILPDRQEVGVARGILGKYIGTYEGVEPSPSANFPVLDWVVTLEADQLMIQIAAWEKGPLFAESETRFFLKKTHLDIEFVKDEKGDVKYLIWYRDGDSALLIRKSQADAKQ